MMDKLTHGILLARIAKQIFVSKVTGKRIPVTVSLHVTNKCNMRCRYCYANFEKRFDHPPDDFTTRELISLIDEIHAEGCRWVILLGGEPLMRDDIGIIIRYIKKKGMLCELVTNGVLIDRNVEEILDVDLLCISIDGERGVNDAIRGKGTYDLAVNGLKIAKDHGIKTRIHATLTTLNNNAKSIKHLAYLAAKFKTTFGFSSPILHEYNEIDELQVPPEEMVKFWKLLKTLKTKYGRNYYTHHALDRAISWPLAPLDVIKDMDRVCELGLDKCHVGERYCYIDSEGYAYPCIVQGIKKGLNVKEVGFKKAWDYLARFTCHACAYVQYMELNDVLDMAWHSIMLGFNVFFK